MRQLCKSHAQWLKHNIVAASRGMHVSPAKHSYAWLPRKCDYQESVTTGQTDERTDGQTDAGQSDPYVPLCFAGDTKMSLSTRYCGNFEFITFLGDFRKGLCWKHCKYKERVFFFLGSWGMNLSTKQTKHRSSLQDLCVSHSDSFPMNPENKSCQKTMTLNGRQPSLNSSKG